MRGVNRVILIGTLGKDPEMKILQSGTAICSFSIAVNESFKNKSTGEWEERAEWILITAFGKTAENAGKYLTKGSKVFIEGKIHTDKWEDKNGNVRYTTKVIVNQLQFLDSKKKRESENNDGGPLEDIDTSDKDTRTEAQKEFDDDTSIPF